MADYETDDLYPNDGSYFGVPLADRRKEAVEEQKEVERLEPLLKESLKRLKKSLASTDSIAEAIAIAKEYEIPRDDALIVLNVVNRVLSKEVSIQEGLYSQYIKR